MRRPRPILKQPTSQELRDTLLDFLERKFYPGRSVVFKKDRRLLLDWVVLWPAKWLDEKAVTIPADEYRKLFLDVFMDGIVHGTNPENIHYLPAYLAKIIQSHFACHGDEIYERAKSLRTVMDRVSTTLAGLPRRQPDPIRELAAAARLLRVKKTPPKPPVNAQLTLL